LGAPTFTEWAQTVLHITAETDWLLEGDGFGLLALSISPKNLGFKPLLEVTDFATKKFFVAFFVAV
jgi:hypothetical protein